MNEDEYTRLTDNNRELIILVMGAINDKISIHGGTEAKIDAIKNITDALGFLKQVKAINDYNPYTYYTEGLTKLTPLSLDSTRFGLEQHTDNNIYIVNVNLPMFKGVLDRLNGNDVNNFTDDSIKFDKESAKATYHGITKKLFSIGTIMNILTYRVVNANGEFIREADILYELDSEGIDIDRNKTAKSLTNARLRVNKYFESTFGITDAIEYERGNFSLNQKYKSRNTSI